VISIKQFLAAGTDDRALTLVVRTLVRGIGQHSVVGDANDCSRFRERMQEISDAIVDGTSPEELLLHATSSLNALEDHNRRAALYHRLQYAELQNMVRMLTSTVGTVSVTSQTNVCILNEIEKNVEVASELDDVRVMKAKLSSCLTDIRKEAQRQQTETEEIIQELRRGLEQARKASEEKTNGQDMDVITRLPLRVEAEKALAESGRAGCQTYAAVMVLDSLQTVNARFGREAGDDVLAEFARMVQKNITPEDRLFRWGGPALVALLPRPASVERVRREFGRVMENKLERTIQTPSRSILIPISARWCLFPVMTAPRLNHQKIDNFSAGPRAQG
jgi:diguanylate cyclase (GGDEF)-like protein